MDCNKLSDGCLWIDGTFDRWWLAADPPRVKLCGNCLEEEDSTTTSNCESSHFGSDFDFSLLSSITCAFDVARNNSANIQRCRQNQGAAVDRLVIVNSQSSYGLLVVLCSLVFVFLLPPLCLTLLGGWVLRLQSCLGRYVERSQPTPLLYVPGT